MIKGEEEKEIFPAMNCNYKSIVRIDWRAVWRMAVVAGNCSQPSCVILLWSVFGNRFRFLYHWSRWATPNRRLATSASPFSLHSFWRIGEYDVPVNEYGQHATCTLLQTGRIDRSATSASTLHSAGRGARRQRNTPCHQSVPYLLTWPQVWCFDNAHRMVSRMAWSYGSCRHGVRSLWPTCGGWSPAWRAAFSLLSLAALMVDVCYLLHRNLDLFRRYVLLFVLRQIIHLTTLLCVWACCYGRKESAIFSPLLLHC